MASPRELRSGTRVRWHLASSDEWREGEVERASPNGEDWLVKHRFGHTWVHFGKLELVEVDPAR